MKKGNWRGEGAGRRRRVIERQQLESHMYCLLPVPLTPVVKEVAAQRVRGAGGSEGSSAHGEPT